MVVQQNNLVRQNFDHQTPHENMLDDIDNYSERAGHESDSQKYGGQNSLSNISLNLKLPCANNKEFRHMSAFGRGCSGFGSKPLLVGQLWPTPSRSQDI